ncbi:hypothetical protein [Botrimarina sp.]|uniref:hypothetical protein n=1 Tax=Botrimarina sp. TaxID=2795802 RepID=UPI0032EEC60A
MIHHHRYTPTLTLLLSLLAAPAGADSLGVNFIGGQHTTGPDGPTVTGVAGVVPQANWKNVAAYTDTLNVSNGAPRADGAFTGITSADGVGFPDFGVAWEADNTWFSRNPAVDNQDEALMQGYIDVSSSDPDVAVSVTNVPFDEYDVIVYIGSSGRSSERRLARVTINGDPESATYFIPNTGSGEFSGPDDYAQATGTSPASAIPSNYVLYEGQSERDFELLLDLDFNGSLGNMGIAGLQVIEAINLTLVVDRATGLAEIQNQTAFDLPFDFYQVLSESGRLSPGGAISLESQDLEGGGPPGAGDGWEVLGQPSAAAVSEGFLQGDSVVMSGESVSLGRLFEPGGAEDLRFRYHQSDTGLTKSRPAVFCDGCISTKSVGDYNGDGRVDAADYTVWRDTLGSTTDLRADGDDSGASAGRIDPRDYAVWSTGFGIDVGGSPIALPEPSAATVLGLCLAVFCRTPRPR